MEKTDIKSLDYEELQQFMASLGEKPFRAKQLYEWMHEKLAADLDEMTNLSKGLRKKLKETTDYTSLEVVERLVSGIDGTEKYLFRLSDGNVIESVLMRYHHGNSVAFLHRSAAGWVVVSAASDTWRAYAESEAVRDARSDLPDSAGIR